MRGMQLLSPHPAFGHLLPKEKDLNSDFRWPASGSHAQTEPLACVLALRACIVTMKSWPALLFAGLAFVSFWLGVINFRVINFRVAGVDDFIGCRG